MFLLDSTLIPASSEALPELMTEKPSSQMPSAIRVMASLLPFAFTIGSPFPVSTPLRINLFVTFILSEYIPLLTMILSPSMALLMAL